MRSKQVRVSTYLQQIISTMFTQVLRFYEIRYLAFIPKGQLVDTFDLASQPSICSVNQATLLSINKRGKPSPAGYPHSSTEFEWCQRNLNSFTHSNTVVKLWSSLSCRVDRLLSWLIFVFSSALKTLQILNYDARL